MTVLRPFFLHLSTLGDRISVLILSASLRVCFTGGVNIFFVLLLLPSFHCTPYGLSRFGEILSFSRQAVGHSQLALFLVLILTLIIFTVVRCAWLLPPMVWSYPHWSAFSPFFPPSCCFELSSAVQVFTVLCHFQARPQV